MRDELIQPSFAIYNSPGVYALLLGSGISRPADIPTGDDVMNDLIYKVAVALGEDIENPNADWYKIKFNQTPTYDLLLEHLGNTKADRQAVLKSYFEPTEHELEEGKKIPTKAHHSIAWLIKHKFIRVVVTTNFDRLLEKALSNIGIEPQIVTENSIDHMQPLQHTEITIFKIHGDYLETNLRNTADELSGYPDSTRVLLQRIFTEYGLIMCGWSGKTDKALQEILEESISPYSTYFASYTVPQENAHNLLQKRHAVQINGIDGDTLFTEIQQMVESLSGIENHPKLSTAIVVNRVKRLLSQPNSQIEIEDIIRSELEQAILKLQEERNIDLWNNKSTRYQAFQNETQIYGDILERLLQILFVLSRYTDGQFSSQFVYIIERIFEMDQRDELRKSIATMLVIYTVGIASTLGQNWGNISAIVEKPYVQPHLISANVPESDNYFTNLLNYFDIMFHNDINHRNPQLFASEMIFNVLLLYIKTYESSVTSLERTYDLLEMLYALIILTYDHRQYNMYVRPATPKYKHYYDRRSWVYLENFWKNISTPTGKKIIDTLFSPKTEKNIAELLKNYCEARGHHTEGGVFPKFYEFIDNSSGLF